MYKNKENKHIYLITIRKNRVKIYQFVLSNNKGKKLFNKEKQIVMNNGNKQG
jgi:hypothetical protein